MKKKICSLLFISMFLFSCKTPTVESNNSTNNSSEETKITLTDSEYKNLSIQGYAAKGIGDFKQYENTPSYKKVSTAEELIVALNDAKYEYETIWDENTSTYTQNLIKEFYREN